MSVNGELMFVEGELPILGSDSEKPCTDAAIYCRKKLFHSHDSPRESLVRSCISVIAESQRVARQCRNSKPHGWFNSYRDPVLHEFVEWAAERLDSLVELLEALLSAARVQKVADLIRLEQSIASVARESLREIARRATSQFQQRSGNRKDRVVAELYDAVHGLLTSYAEANEIIYLARWVCNGVRPVAGVHDEILAEREGGQGSNGI